ncbi:LCP family glycopolymer transferase [Cohnella mopanensis]|uniref:LCP family glycopolymer transferase n=1 Tax=Cohnella mopanensis TaxID=2911966 RepID=UPI001EF941EA|nr:LCP family protein [Cohnella mopanensis]
MMKRVKVVRIIIYTLLSLITLAILGGGYLWYSMRQTMDAIYEPLPSTKWEEPVFEAEPTQQVGNADRIVAQAAPYKNMLSSAVSTLGQTAASEEMDVLDAGEADRIRHPDLQREDPFSLLLLGVDERVGDRGRSDTMILLTIQPKSESAVAISIPRDTRVLIPHMDKYDKINHAYAFGGTSLSVQAVEQLFGVPISYYMKTNMEGFVKIVDTLGGVDVVNKREFTSNYHFPEGSQHLDGDHALSYIRMRKEDPQGDFGRTQRQRDVLGNAVERVTNVSSILKLPKLLSHLSNNVKTNLSSQDMLALAKTYRPAIHKVDTLILNGTGERIDGIYYYTVKPEDRQNVRQRLLEHLRDS